MPMPAKGELALVLQKRPDPRHSAVPTHAKRKRKREYPEGSRKEFLENCKSGKYNSVKAIYRSNVSTSITSQFDEELLAVLPPSVKYICHNGAGYDNIDISARTIKGISVSSTPQAVDNATADIATWLMIGALRRISIPYFAIQKNQWRGAANLGYDPQNRVLGILGMGGIGRALAHRARAFNMKIIYHNRKPLSDELARDAIYVSFDELLSQSDVISLNLSLNASTRHIISSNEFEKMKDGVVVVNTARGPLIDEAALVGALESGKVFSPGLDVFEEEPKVHPGLLNNDNVVILPHMGTSTFETQADMELLVIANLKKAIKEDKLLTQVPEQVKPESNM
ncbi:hypothetical protein V493_00624 [Pseudogymnoascus sp. VKM F-4281 (FW-2241)]|nr:hypothetical protein V493_00624 [Pseudogymnoascus sp. VKM F-4281 (FW-2241)]